MARKPLTPLQRIRQVRGLRSQLTRSITACEDGAYVQLDLRTAEKLREVCRDYTDILRERDEMLNGKLK